MNVTLLQWRLAVVWSGVRGREVVAQAKGRKQRGRGTRVAEVPCLVKEGATPPKNPLDGVRIGAVRRAQARELSYLCREETGVVSQELEELGRYPVAGPTQHLLEAFPFRRESPDGYSPTILPRPRGEEPWGNFDQTSILNRFTWYRISVINNEVELLHASIYCQHATR